MAKIKLEYIWLDGYHPTQNMRSKTKVEEHENFQGTIEELENWSFDGSSTRQDLEAHLTAYLNQLRSIQIQQELMVI